MKFKLSKDQWIYAGVGLLVFLVLVSSTNPTELKEVTDPQSDQAFDYDMLPPKLKPPYKMADGDTPPRNIKMNLNYTGLTFKPRFDNY